MESFTKPIVGVINGYALGGGMEIALACDFLIASPTAKFSIPEVKYGIIPGWGGTQRLPKIVGRGNAMEMILSGEMVDAEKAYELGIINKIVDDPLEEAKKICKNIAENAPLSLKYAKLLINNSFYNKINNSLETEYFAKCFNTQDQKEGMNSFFEKRKPKFKGE